MNVGIVGLGSIAATISTTLKKLNDKNIVLYACASRSEKKAEAFAKKYGFKKSYGDYTLMLADENVDVVYVATPHPFHYKFAAAAIDAGKNVIVEKPVCTDAKKLEDLIDLTKRRNVFLTEAMWTAFDPLVVQVKNRLSSGEFGKILSVGSSFGMPLKHVRRLTEKELAGGALLDLGIYCVFHSTAYCDAPDKAVTAKSRLYKTGVDLTTTVSVASDGFNADFKCSFARFFKNDVTIDTEKAVISFDRVNFPTKLKIKDKSSGKTTTESIKVISGYEYEFIAVQKYIASGKTQTDEMPLSLSKKMLSVCDSVRRLIGLTYPFD